jgi:transmembrane protein TMEM260 (protein O-mannosyltransferase)
LKSGFKQSLPFAATAFLLPLVLYLITAAPSVWFIDSGELALACSKLGITHPTGYPLFTIIGRFFVLILPFDPAFALNIMCAVFVSASLVIFFYFNIAGRLKEMKKEPYFVTMLLSLVPVFILGFTLTVWDFATSVEVYSLQLTFFTILLLLCYRLYYSGNNETKKTFYIFIFLFGLSFTNHLTTIILLPPVIYLVYLIRDKLIFTLRSVFTSIILFLSALSLYLYLPIRNSSVLFNWGDPGNFKNIIDHISGEQYIRYKVSAGIFSSLTKFLERIPVELSYPVIIIIIAGIIYLFLSDKKLLGFLILIVASNILVVSFYKIPDISNYYLISLVVLALLSGYGLIYFYVLIKPYFREIVYVLPLAALIPLLMNFSSSDKSKINVLETYNNNLYSSLDQNSILLTGKWDYIVSPSLYYQYVKNIRPDLIIIDIKLIKTSWYIKYLMKAKPELYNSSKQYFDAHLEEALKFESDKEVYLNPKTQADIVNANSYRAAYMNLLKSIMETHPGKFYTTYDIPADSSFWIVKDYKKIPAGILLKYSKNDTLIEFDDLKNINYSLPQYNNPYVKAMKDNYLVSLVNKSKYMVKYRQPEIAKMLLNKAVEIDPGYTIAKDLLRKLESN